MPAFAQVIICPVIGVVWSIKLSENSNRSSDGEPGSAWQAAAATTAFSDNCEDTPDFASKDICQSVQYTYEWVLFCHIKVSFVRGSDCRPQCGPSPMRHRLLDCLSVNGLDRLAVAAMYVPANVQRTGYVIVCCIMHAAVVADELRALRVTDTDMPCDGPTGVRRSHNAVSLEANPPIAPQMHDRRYGTLASMCRRREA